MLKRLEDITQYLDLRSASIRTKVMLAFLGVLLLILPQIVLTVAYMVELFQAGERIDRSGAAAQLAGQIHLDLEATLNATFPADKATLASRVTAVAETDQLMAKTQVRFEEFRKIDGRFGSSAEEVAGLRDNLAAYIQSLKDGFESGEALKAPVERKKVSSRLFGELQDRYLAWEPASPDETVSEEVLAARFQKLQGLATGAVEQVVSAQNRDDKALAKNAANRRAIMEADVVARAKILSRVGSLRDLLTEQNQLAGGRIQQSVDEANRYLITLVLLTLVYIFVVVLVLPSRLVRPLVHVSSVMERAATGQLDVRARVAGDDEMGDLGQNLNKMLERLGSFDRLKRDRIYEDAGRIRALGDLIDHPLAILDTHFAFEYANKTMRNLLQLPDGVEGKGLAQTMGGRDSRDLIALLDKALKRRRPLDGIPLTLKTSQGDQSLRLSARPGRNRAGQISYLILTLSK